MASAELAASTESHSRALPLSVYIAVLFSLLIVLTGGTIAWFNYTQNTRIVLAAGDRVFDELYSDVVADLELGSSRNSSTLAMLSFAPVNAARTLDQRLTSLPLFREAIDGNERIASLYVGYDDGDFFQVLRLGTPEHKAFYRAPEHASYLVWSIEREPRDTVDSRYLFFDRDLVSLGERSVEGPSYDPRERPWYRTALDPANVHVTAPYAFFATGGVGMTGARRNAAGTGVVAGDLTLAALSALLAERLITPSAALAIYAANGDVIAYHDRPNVTEIQADDATPQLQTLATLEVPVLFEIAKRADGRDLETDLVWQDRHWKGVQRRLVSHADEQLYLVVAAPVDELVAEAEQIRMRSVLLTGGLVVTVLPLAWLISLLVARPLRTLEAEARGIQAFDFRQLVVTRSPVREVNRLAGSMSAMKRTIRDFLAISADLAAERRLPDLLEEVAREAMQAAEAEAAILYLANDDVTRLDPAGLALRSAPVIPGNTLLPVSIANDRGGGKPNRLAQLETTQTFEVAVDEITQHPETALALEAALGGSLPLATAVPLKTPHGQVVGVLSFLRAAPSDPARPRLSRDRIAFVEALAGVAAVAIDNQRLFEAQKNLLDALIKLVAGAIDAKSPYTGGHCQRVPVITRLLAEAACASQQPPFENFSLSRDDWEALEIACWLHDCGKITTPEYVVDKATKLQTLYDRIHEVRMRFEVLKRDAEIAYWQAVAEGGDRTALRRHPEEAWRALDEDYAFVARCNEGGEFMAPEHLDRLQRIGKRRWLRTLDDRIGISWEERTRKAAAAASPLPVSEPLLADKPEHRLRRSPSDKIAEDNPWGFRLDMPLDRYNRGELHNLSVARGTLTAEERFIIDNHVVQTIVMLAKLPFPSHLRSVPEYAGGHHEKINGTGYPRRLTGDAMSVPARMMVIADVFEALTARDRPYKEAKTLSEAIKIMDLMCKNGEIDPDLFELFMTSGVYVVYAQQYLQPEQIDTVDIARDAGVPR